nr:zinc finger, CCHC-type [Tanacetum cinerariifolium]
MIGNRRLFTSYMAYDGGHVVFGRNLKGRSLVEQIEMEMRMKLRMLSTDRGGEFTSNEFTKFCKENGIARQLIAPYSPQQNGVVERRNRTVLSTTRTYAKITTPHLKKLDDRSIPLIYLGVEEGSKVCRLYDPAAKKKHVSRDVSFVIEGVDNENATLVNTDINGDDDNTYQEPYTIHDPVSPITPPTYTYNPHSDEEVEATISSIENSKKGFDHIPVRGFKKLTNIYQNTQEVETNTMLLTKEEPHNYKEASTDKKWIEAIEIELDLINKNNTWILTTLLEIDVFKSQMKEKYDMSDLALLAYYLGIEVTQTEGEITIKQVGYITKILKETYMMDSNDAKIPMDPGTKLVKAEDGNSVDTTYYRSLIGSLRYLLHTRPDLSYSVGLLSRFMQGPKEHHLKAEKQHLEKGLPYLESQLQGIKEKQRYSRRELTNVKRQVASLESQVEGLEQKVETLKKDLNDANFQRDADMENLSSCPPSPPIYKRMEDHIRSCILKMINLIREHPWIPSNEHLFGIDGAYDYINEVPSTAWETCQELRIQKTYNGIPVNIQVQEPLEKAENDYKQLKTNMKRIKRDIALLETEIENTEEERNKLMETSFLEFKRISGVDIVLVEERL